MKKDWVKINEEVSAALDGVDRLTGASEGTQDPPKRDGRFGTDLSRAAAEAVTVMRKVPLAFTAIGFTAEEVQDNLQAATNLRGLAFSLHKTSEQLLGKAQYYDTLVSVQSGKVFDVTEANELNPSPQPFSPALKKAAEPLRAILDERRDALTSNRAKGKQARGEQQTDKDRIRTLEVENKYLAGDELRPEDVVGPDGTSTTRRVRRG